MENWQGNSRSGVVPFRGIGQKPEKGEWGFEGFFLFIVIPMIIAVAITAWTERRIFDWMVRSADEGSPARTETRAGHSGGDPGASSTPSFDEARATMLRDVEALNEAKAEVLEALVALGPPHLWTVDPALKAQVLDDLGRITPDVYDEWRARCGGW